MIKTVTVTSIGKVPKYFTALLQELSSVLKQFEKRLRAVEKAQLADDTEAYLHNVTEAIKLHTAVATLCEEIAAMQAPYLPKLLQDHADGVVARATMQQVRAQGLSRIGE